MEKKAWIMFCIVDADDAETGANFGGVYDDKALADKDLAAARKKFPEYEYYLEACPLNRCEFGLQDDN